MKRSSKKYRNPEKKARKKQAKKMIAAGMMVCLGTLPIWCDDEVLLTLFPMGSKSVGSYADVQYDMGVGGKLTWRKNGNLDFFVEGDYKNLTLPNVSSATMINGGVGAGYHLPINDRWGVNFSAQVGGYRASKSDGVLTGLSGGLNISMTYRINSKVSVEAGAAANHYVATPEPLLTDVGATAGLTLNLTKAFSDSTKVSMETKEVLPVFPVLYSWYKNNSFASVGITNEEDAAIENVQVSFYQPQYMSQPNLCATTEKLGKGETFDAELTAFFNESMLDLTEKTNTEASVIIEYTYLGEKKKKTISMVVPVYGRNSMSWDDDRRASVFVSSKDPAALWFSKYISSIVRDNVRMGVSPNIQYAMGIFETLDQFGINYVIDPSSAYSDNVGSTSIDFLQFPYQTLTYRGGDCDDLSILTCSLFEAVGIKTAFITIPGHIFMAFDSGMTINEAKQAMMNTDNMINHDGEAWVPLEITLTDEGFSRAWRTGAREWNQAYKDGTAAFYAMEDSWKIYDPVSVPGAAANFTMPEKEIVSRLFQHSMDEWIAREISPVVAEYNARLAMHDTVELRNELGILYGKYGLFVEADDQFKRARRKGYLPSLLNTANVYFARKQYTIALEWYKKVLEEDSGNELAILGLARCYYELEDYDQCDDAFDIVRHKNPSLASEYTYLGAFEETVGRSYSLADRIALTKWDTGNTSSGITNTGNNSGYDDGYGTEDSNGFVIVDTGDTIIENAHGGEADSLLTQLADLNSSNGMLRPDAVVHEEKKTVLPPDPYAAMDDYNNLVEELPGLLAQLTIPGTNLDEPAPVMVSDTRIASVNATTTPDGGIEEARPTQPKQTEPKKDLSSLINRSNLEPKQTVAAVTPAPAVTQPKVQETPVTVATTATVTQPVVEQTPVTVATTVTVTEPTVATTPVTVATTATVTQPAAVTQPVVEVTPVTVATTAPVTQPTVVQTPVTVATTTPVTQPAAVTQPVVEQTPATVTPTVAVTQPVVEQTPVTVTPTVAVTQPVVETTPATVTPTVAVTQPVVEQTPVTVTPTVAVTQPVVETTPATVTPTVAVTQPVVEQTPVTVTPTVAVTQPVVEQTPVTVTQTVAVSQPVVETTPATVTPTVAVTQPVVEQTPVTVTPTVAVTQPVVEQTPVTVTPTVAVTQPVVEQTPVTVTPTVAVTQPVVEQTPVTVTPTVAVTQPVVEQTPVTVTPTVAVTQPVVEQTPVTVTPTVTVTQPVVEQTPVTVTPTVAVTQPVVEQTPVTVTPTVAVTQPVVEQTPVTVTPTVAVTQPVVEQTPVTVTPTVAVTQPVVEQTPVTVTPTVAVTQPVVEQTPVTVTPTVAVTQPVVEQTPATVTPTVAVTQPVVEQAPVTVTPTVTVTQPVVEQTPVTVTPTVAVTQPVVEQTPVTVTPTVAVTQPVVEQTPVTVTPTVTVTQPVVEQTPVTVTPTVAVTQPVVEQTPVTVATTAPVTQPTVVQTPVNVTPTVAVTQPVVEQTPVTVATTAPVTQPTVVQTPVTVTTTTPVTQPAAVTQPVVEQAPVTVTPTVAVTQPTTPQFTTEPVVIRDTQTVLDELGLEEEDVFAALMNEDDDMFADTPVGALIAEEKAKEAAKPADRSVIAGPELPPLQNTESKDTNIIQQEEEIAFTSVVPTVERAAPRFSDSPSSKWVPEEVYTAKIIPGMKTYEEEMSTYSQDKSWLYEDNTGLLSDDTEEAIAMEKAKEIMEEEERENARLAQENWDKLISDDMNDPSNPLFSYLSKENLEEIQTVSIVDKIREQEKLSPAEKLANEKKSGLLAKTNEILKKDAEARKPKVKEPVEELVEEQPPIAQISPIIEEKPVDIVEKTDSNIAENTEIKKSGVWPYVAGGAGLLGLFVIFLIVFWKRDDKDDEDKNNSLEKQGVNI